MLYIDGTIVFGILSNPLYIYIYIKGYIIFNIFDPFIFCIILSYKIIIFHLYLRIKNLFLLYDLR